MKIAGYSEITRVGQGGIGDVYRAQRDSTGGTVALKILRIDGDEATMQRRVHREVAALLQLKGHPYVVHVEEVIQLESTAVVVMEFAKNGSLAGVLADRKRLHPPEVLLAATHVASALRDAHERGIVHRDIKPHNLLLGEFGQVKVCDFGISALTKGPISTDRTSALSYRYASPEELEDEPDVGPPTDVYSLGVTMRQLATGETKRNASEEPGNWLVGVVDPDEIFLTHNLWRLVESMTEHHQAKRPTAAAVVDKLERLDRELGDRRVKSIGGLPSHITQSTPAVVATRTAALDDDTTRPRANRPPPSSASALAPPTVNGPMTTSPPAAPPPRSNPSKRSPETNNGLAQLPTIDNAPSEWWKD